MQKKCIFLLFSFFLPVIRPYLPPPHPLYPATRLLHQPPIPSSDPCLRPLPPISSSCHPSPIPASLFFLYPLPPVLREHTCCFCLPFLPPASSSYPCLTFLPPATISCPFLPLLPPTPASPSYPFLLSTPHQK